MQNIFLLIEGSYAFKKHYPEKTESKESLNDFDIHIAEKDFKAFKRAYNIVKIRNISKYRYIIFDFLSKNIELVLIPKENDLKFKLFEEEKKKNKDIFLLEGRLNVHIARKEYLYINKKTHIHKNSKEKWKKDFLYLLKDNSIKKINLVTKFKKLIEQQRLENSREVVYHLLYQKKINIFLNKKEINQYDFNSFLDFVINEKKKVKNRKELVIFSEKLISFFRLSIDEKIRRYIKNNITFILN